MSITLAEPRAAETSAQQAVAPLVAQLAAADGVAQREKGSIFVLRAWPWVGGAVLAAIVLDVLLHLAAGWRVAVVVGIASLVSGLLAVGAWVAWMRRNPAEHTARALEDRDPRLGSKLINVLQLRAQCEDPAVAPLTRDLAALAIAGYVAELRRADLPQVARTGRVPREAKRMGLGGLGFLAILALAFPISRVELPRFFDPFGDHPPFSFTRLEIIEPGDDSAAVVYGQNIVIGAEARGHRPDELFLTFFAPENPAARTTVPMFDKGESGFSQQIEGIRTNLTIFAHTKNEHAVSKQRRIAVILTPKLEKATVKIAAPAYTGRAAEERGLQFKSLKALEGSELTFRIASNRPLAQGRISVINASGTVQPVTMELVGENEVAGTVVARESGQLKFSIVDREGFSSQETWELALIVTHDLPPEVQITNPNSDSFVAMDFKPEPVVEAGDDHGLKTLRIHTARNDVFGEPRTIEFEKPPLNAREGMVFNLREMDLKSGDRISIFAEAIDSAPEPHLVRSKTVTLTVITTEEYNDFLREQTDLGDLEAKYSKLLGEFHELVEQQKKLGTESDALKAQLTAATTEAERTAAQEKLDALMAKQQQINEQLKDLAKTMENFVRDQPLYDLEAELKQTLAEKAQEIRDSVKANEEAMQKLAQDATQRPGNPPESRPNHAQASVSPEAIEAFKNASDEQVGKLGEAEQEAQEQVAQTLEDMSLMHEIVKDMNRFKELYEAQQQLAQQAKAYDRPTPLTREDQFALRDMAALQKEIGDQLDAVEQKLWEDGQTAQEKFPKAGKSAQDLAQKMGDLRLPSLAGKATTAMLASSGTQGAQLAESLRGEMEKLFSQCNGKEGEMSGELDQYLSVQRSMKPGNNFKQMMQTRKFGNGRTPGLGAGKGFGGQDGYAVITGPNANVLGGETRISESEKAAQGGPNRSNAQPDATAPTAAVDKQDVVDGVQPVNRESKAVQGEAGIEQYSEIVEKYFKAITKPVGKPTKP